MTGALPPDGSLLAVGSMAGAVTLVGGALALGIRHGIDWDHIAAITDITSTSATIDADGEADGEEDGDEGWLTREPGLQVTDESHHHRPAPVGARASLLAAEAPPPVARATGLLRRQRRPLLLGTLYALGHGAVVTALGLTAILASGFLPEWIDPVMGRVVGATLLFLAAYLYYSIYRYLRGGSLRLRSRWMLVFAVVRSAYRWLLARIQGHEYHRVAHADQYGPRTAFAVGMIHGVGAETGTQVLVIATAVGAGSRAAGIVALLAFVLGLLISNSFITVATATGFVSAGRRQRVYMVAGLVAATFSLALGLVFLTAQDMRLPDLGGYFGWIGGPS